MEIPSTKIKIPWKSMEHPMKIPWRSLDNPLKSLQIPMENSRCLHFGRRPSAKVCPSPGHSWGGYAAGHASLGQLPHGLQALGTAWDGNGFHQDLGKAGHAQNQVWSLGLWQWAPFKSTTQKIKDYELYGQYTSCLQMEMMFWYQAVHTSSNDGRIVSMAHMVSWWVQSFLLIWFIWEVQEYHYEVML